MAFTAKIDFEKPSKDPTFNLVVERALQWIGSTTPGLTSTVRYAVF
jgi:hypothetical protein